MSVYYATLLVKALAKFAKNPLNKKIIEETLLYLWEYKDDSETQEFQERIVIESMMPSAAKGEQAQYIAEHEDQRYHVKLALGLLRNALQNVLRIKCDDYCPLLPGRANISMPMELFKERGHILESAVEAFQEYYKKHPEVTLEEQDLASSSADHARAIKEAIKELESAKEARAASAEIESQGAVGISR